MGDAESCTSASEIDIDEMRERILVGLHECSFSFQECFRSVFESIKDDYKDQTTTDLLISKDMFVKSYSEEAFSLLSITET